MSASAGDVEVVVATSAPARKLSKKQSFTGMPYDDEFCLSKDQAVKLLSHGGLNAKDTEAALQEVRVCMGGGQGDPNPYTYPLTVTLRLPPDGHERRRHVPSLGGRVANRPPPEEGARSGVCRARPRRPSPVVGRALLLSLSCVLHRTP